MNKNIKYIKFKRHVFTGIVNNVNWKKTIEFLRTKNNKIVIETV